MRQWQQLQWKWGKAQIGHELRRVEVRNEIPTSLCEAPLLVHSTNCCLLRFYVLQRGGRFFPLTSSGVSNESFDKTNTDELRVSFEFFRWHAQHVVFCIPVYTTPTMCAGKLRKQIDDEADGGSYE